MGTTRRRSLNFSLRVLFAVVALVCIVSALIRLHFSNLERIETVRRHIADAGGRAFSTERDPGRWHLDPAFSVRIELRLDKLTQENYASLAAAASLMDREKGQRVEHLRVRRGGGLANLEQFRAAVVAFAPDLIEFDGIGDREFAAIADELPCETISHLSRFEAHIMKPLVLRCQHLMIGGPDVNRFWQHVAPESDIRIASVKFAGSQDALMFDPLPSLRQVFLDAGHLEESEIRRLIFNLRGIQVQLKCCGPDDETKNRLEDAFHPGLTLDLQPCPHTPGSPIDPFQ